MNKTQFINELKIMNIDITEDQLDKLEMYYQILIEKNKIMNLTGIVDKDLVYLKHFYDSLTINKIIELNTINNLCDLGSGAGFPGIVIKILFPKIKITLVDSLNKRIEFLKHVIKELDLKNIEVISSRIEEYSIKNIEKYDLVTARAVAPTNILLEIGIQLVKVKGNFVTMKGNKEELSKDIYNKLSIKKTKEIEFKLPVENSNRTLTLYNKIQSTNSIFPRRYSEIKKKSL